MKINKQIKVVSLLIILVVLVTFTTIKVVGVLLGSSTHVFEDDDLTYYINIYYDGKDVHGIESNDTTIAEIKSDYIYVEDKLPEGLIFNGFVTTDDGTIGAVNRKDGESCQGKVIDGVDGLNYNQDTRTISFKIKDLRAGCMLTVGIKTKTPTLPDGVSRMDFFNTASAIEDVNTVISNTVHAWIGDEETEDSQKYDVIYQYIGTIPENVTPVPTTKKYVEGSKVGIEANGKAVGYTFSGWTTNDVVVDDGTFTMPDKTVTFTATFTENPSYTIRYQINGIQPDGYVLPELKTYYAGMRITLDSLTKGDIINGYRFLGWTTADANIDLDNGFTMPSTNVIITGSFEEVKYKVSYAFQGINIPNNASSLLPETVSYKPGEVVKLATMPSTTGYKFLGWYKEDNFTMPNEDVVIYGEWGVEKGTFKPNIKYEIVDKKDSYNPGDKIVTKVTITNNEDYSIFDIVIKGESDYLEFVQNDDFTFISNSLVKIDEIEPKSSVEIYLEYEVKEKDSGIVESSVEIIGSLADDNYVLDTEVDYKKTIQTVISSKLRICNKVDGGSDSKIFLFHINGLNYDSWITLGKNECKTISLSANDYNVKQLIPQDYQLNSVTGAINKNGDKLTVNIGQGYEITFNNKYSKKGYYHTFGRIENIIRNIGGNR